MRGLLTSFCPETIRNRRCSFGASLSRSVCTFQAAPIEGGIWYAALGDKHPTSQVSFSDGAAFRGSFGRGNGFSFTNRHADPATCYRHYAASESTCGYSAGRSGGGGGFSPLGANAAKGGGSPGARSRAFRDGTRRAGDGGDFPGGEVAGFFGLRLAGA